jgi:pilus assembly protein Flp/PilA
MRKSTLQKEEKKMISRFRAMVKDEKGAALAEYGLLLALIAVVCIVALQALGVGISGTLASITAQL